MTALSSITHTGVIKISFVLLLVATVIWTLIFSSIAFNGNTLNTFWFCIIRWIRQDILRPRHLVEQWWVRIWLMAKIKTPACLPGPFTIILYMSIRCPQTFLLPFWIPALPFALTSFLSPELSNPSKHLELENLISKIWCWFQVLLW